MGKINFKERYDRNFNTLSADDQKRLKDSRVVIIGLGGLGGGVCEMLARVGIGHLTLIDGDFFEPSNLNRQLLSQENLMGEPKAEVAKKRVNKINSEVDANFFVQYLDESNMYESIKNADLVVDCLDSIDTRLVLQSAANKASIPIVSGAIAGMTGQVTTIFPGDIGYKLIYGDMINEHSGIGQSSSEKSSSEKSTSEKSTSENSKGIETITGNLGCCALFVAAVQSSEVLKVLLNRKNTLQNKLLISELWTNSFEIVHLT